MAKLSTRQLRYPGCQAHDSGKRILKGYTLPQRKRKVLKPGAKPQHGVSQPMPARA